MNEILTLIDTIMTKDSEGFETYAEKSRYNIFVRNLNITTSEFYQSTLAGIKNLIKLECYIFDFKNQIFAEYKGKIYKIIRTYTKKNDLLELTLSLKEGIQWVSQ